MSLNDFKKTEYYNLRVELEDFASKGLEISLEGNPASPHRIAETCVCCEDCCYMRDYVSDDSGNIVCLDFVRIIN